jgi:hypothetical protein
MTLRMVKILRCFRREEVEERYQSRHRFKARGEGRLLARSRLWRRRWGREARLVILGAVSVGPAGSCLSRRRQEVCGRLRTLNGKRKPGGSKSRVEEIE